MGSIYRRGRIYWIGYRGNDGAWAYESSRSVHKEDARRLLRDREGDVDRTASVGQLSFTDAAKAALADYRVNKRRSLSVFERRIDKHLTPFFGEYQLADITTPLIRQFIEARQAGGASNAEINRELDALSKMFKIAMQDGTVLVRPHVPKLRESAPRKGFVTPSDFQAVADRLEPHMRAIWTFLYLTGWRVSEALSLRWEHVGPSEIRYTDQTKADEPARTIPITKQLRELLTEQKRQIGTMKTAFVFTFFRTTPKGNIRKARAGTSISYGGWLNAFRDARAAAGVRANLLAHDCRRTAIDRMERKGIARSTAMALVGHKTEAAYRRYAIVSAATLQDAAERLDE